MSHQLLMEILRLFHIVAGALWVGAVVMMAFFIGPTARALGPASGAMMNQLTRKLPGYMGAIAGITVLAGLSLMFVDARGGTWTETSMGRTFSLGGGVALIAFIWGIAFTSRTARRLSARASALAAAGHPPTPEEQAELQQGFARLGLHTRIVAILLLIAVALMALARYA